MLEGNPSSLLMALGYKLMICLLIGDYMLPLEFLTQKLCFVAGLDQGFLGIAGSMSMTQGVSRQRHLLMKQGGVTL